MIYRVHAAVSIRLMYVMNHLSTQLIVYTGLKTDQTARKFAGVNGPLQRTLGALGVRPPPTPLPPGRYFFHEIKTCQDSTNSNNLSAMVIVQ